MKNNYSMNTDKELDQSLKNKISANDQKIQSLFKLKNNIMKNKNNNMCTINTSQKISYGKDIKRNSNLKISNRDLHSFRNNKENQKNLINLQLTPIFKKENTNIKYNNSKFSSFIQPSNNNSIDKNTNAKANTNKNNPKIKIKYKELENFINVKQSNNNNKPYMTSKTKKVKKKPISISNRTDRNTFKSSITKFDCNLSKSKLNNKKSSNSFDFSLTYERFIENESKKKEKISKIRKMREKFERQIYPHIPKINQKSKSMTKSNTDDFLIRLEKYKKEQIEKEELLKKNILKDEEEKINKSNFLLFQKKIKKKRAKDSVDKSYNNKTIAESVNKLLEWGKKKKEKIENEIKKQNLMEKSNHIPKINKYKKEFKEGSTKKIYDRLYNKNKYMFGFKKELFTQQSTPKFRSKVNKTKSQTNISFNLTKVISVYSNEDNNNNYYKEEKEKEDSISNLSFINNEDEQKTLNITERIVFDEDKYKKQNEDVTPVNKNKNKSIIVVIRKIKSQMNILNKNT